MDKQIGKFPYVSPSLELFQVPRALSLMQEFSLESDYDDWGDGAPIDATSSYSDWGSGPDL